VTLTDQSALPDAPGAHVGQHLQTDRSDEPQRLRLFQQPGEFFGFSEMRGDGYYDGENENAGDETGLSSEFHSALF
jgi:hypothetical protein